MPRGRLRHGCVLRLARAGAVGEAEVALPRGVAFGRVVAVTPDGVVGCVDGAVVIKITGEEEVAEDDSLRLNSDSALQLTRTP